MSLQEVYDILEDINDDSSRLEKEKIIGENINNELFKKVIFYALDPFKMYNTREIDYIENSNNATVESIFKYLDFLATKRGCTDSEKLHLSKLASIDEETVNVINRIVTKDLKCGASIKTFRKFFKDIPTHELMLCNYSTEDVEKFIKFVGGLDKFVWSRKLDGVRCWAEIDNTDISYLSRNGLEYNNFNILDDEIFRFTHLLHVSFPEEFKTGILTLDGEITSNDKQFQKLMTQTRRLKEFDSSLFEYHIFDIVLPNKAFHERYSILKKIFDENKFTKLQLVEHCFTEFKSADDIRQYCVNFCKDEKGNYVEEGIVLKGIYSPYEFKRSNYWCKVKPVLEADVEVTGFIYGTKGKKHQHVVGKLKCIFTNGEKFNVGTGYSDEEREEFLTNTPKIIQIEYSGLTDRGAPKFGRFIRRRDDKETTTGVVH